VPVADTQKAAHQVLEEEKAPAFVVWYQRSETRELISKLQKEK